MKRLLLSLLVLGLVLLVASLPSAKADDVFTNADVRGPYGFSFDGAIVGVGPVAAVGVFVADGNGNLTDGVRTLSVNGSGLHQTFTCTYTVHSNGPGSVLSFISTRATGTQRFAFVLI